MHMDLEYKFHYTIEGWRNLSINFVEKIKKQLITS